MDQRARQDQKEQQDRKDQKGRKGQGSVGPEDRRTGRHRTRGPQGRRSVEGRASYSSGAGTLTPRQPRGSPESWSAAALWVHRQRRASVADRWHDPVVGASPGSPAGERRPDRHGGVRQFTTSQALALIGSTVRSSAGVDRGLTASATALAAACHVTLADRTRHDRRHEFVRGNRPVDPRHGGHASVRRDLRGGKRDQPDQQLTGAAAGASRCNDR